MAKNAAQITLGADGSIYAAPPGTAEPADITTALSASWVDLGFVSEDGAEMTASMSMEEIRVWQSVYPVRRVVTERDFTLGFSLAQWNRDTIPFFFGGGNITGGSAGPWRFDPPDPSFIDERMLSLEWSDGTKDYRIVVTNGMVTDTDNTNLQRADAAWLPVTYGALGGTAGTQPWYLQTNDPSFAP